MADSHVDHIAMFDRIYNEVPVGVLLVSPGGQLLKMNPAVCAMLGYEADELRRLSFRDITYPADVDTDLGNQQQLLEGKLAAYHCEKRCIAKGGGIVWVSLHAAVVRDGKDGQPLYFLTCVSDITASKKAEEKLLEDEAAFNLITRHARDILYYSTPDGVCLYVSPSIYDLLGYHPEEVVGKVNLELYHPDDLAFMMDNGVSEDEPLVYRMKDKDGHYHWFETTFKNIRDGDGNIEKVVAIGRDVTERKRYENSLAEAQRIAMLGSWEWDVEQDKLEYTPDILRIHGIDPSDAKDKPGAEMIELVHEDDRERIQEAFRRSMETGAPFSEEYMHKGADGTIRYFHVRGMVVRHKDGKPSRMRGTIQDITDRRLVELQLHESYERYNSLKKYNHDAIMSLDLEGNIIGGNKMATELTGYTVKEMSGMSLSAFIEGERVAELLDAAADEGKSDMEIGRIRHRDGHWTEVLSTVAPIVIRGARTGYYIIAKDITEQKKLLVEKEAAERTNKAKSNFFAMMSHEIRTPMNGVIGMTDLLLETELTEEQREYVEVLRKSGESLIKIINDILDFSKLDMGRESLVEEPLDLKATVQDAIDLFAPLARKKEVGLKRSLDGDLPSPLIGDPHRLLQVLTNLLSNSIKFTDEGFVSIALRKCSEDAEFVTVEFIVKDTGVGIPADKAKYLFEPFSQLDPFMSRKAGGTGLGLAISKKLVTMMGGDIGLLMTGEPGTAFRFTARFRKAAEAAGAQ
ncbi:MAG TPA: PAS domain S-box protein [Paenibacillus sp.]|uniref:PAS domain-containing protein n=1 Tax=Paenibacillus sp. TaxID=58172 RepID=UPI002CEB1A06|nr:PAS domain S-box protein [Paenibacillus sp.]HUC92140.1 PAS domain S-box protein [Paenibacillus sp.]